MTRQKVQKQVRNILTVKVNIYLFRLDLVLFTFRVLFIISLNYFTNKKKTPLHQNSVLLEFDLHALELISVINKAAVHGTCFL